MARPSQTDPRERSVVLMLRDERIRQGLSATQLAEKIGVSRSTITHNESDDARPTFWLLLKWSDGLGVKTGDWLAKPAKKSPAQRRKTKI